MIALLLVAATLSLQDAPEQVGGVRLTVPKDWKRTEGADKSITFTPPGLAEGQRCSVTVIATQPFEGTPEAWHDGLWASLSEGFTVTSKGMTKTVGSFKAVTGALKHASGEIAWFTLYSALDGKKGEAIVFGAGSEALCTAHAETVRAMVAGAQLGAGPPADKPETPAKRDTIGLLNVEIPAGWTKTADANGAVTLHSPDSKPEAGCKVVFYVALDTDKPLKEQHAMMWAKIQALGERKNEESGTAGPFTWSAVEVSNAQGRAWFRLYSMLAGSKYVPVLLGADTAELAARHVPVVTAMIEKATIEQAPVANAPAPTDRGPKAVGTRTTIGALDLVVIDGWTVKEDAASGWTSLTPPPSEFPVDTCAYIRSGFPLEGTWWASHRKAWSSICTSGGMKDEDPVLNFPDGPGDFICTVGRWRLNMQHAPYVRLYTARSGGSLVAVLYTSTSAGHWGAQTWPLERMLRSAAIKDAPARKTPTIAEAYHCVQAKITYHADGSSSRSIRDARIVLFENGAADFSTKVEPGYEGYPFWKIDPDLNDGWYGGWKASGNDVLITRGGKQEKYARDGANLRFGDQVWTPMPRVDGLKLKGRFARKSQPGDPIQFYEFIEFLPDGRFSMSGILWSPIVEATPQKVPDKGAGTYEIRNWTLHLKLDDGFTQSQDFLIMEGDVKNPDAVWLRSQSYAREK